MYKINLIILLVFFFNGHFRGKCNEKKRYIYPFLAMAGTSLPAFVIVAANLRFCTGKKKKNP